MISYETLKADALNKLLETIDNQQSEIGTASPIETISDLLNTYVVKEGNDCSPEYLQHRVYVTTFLMTFLAKLHETYSHYKLYSSKVENE